ARTRGIRHTGGRLGGRAARRAEPLLQRGRPRRPRRAADAYERHARARDRRDRARAYRHRLALAARRELPEDGADVQQSDALHGTVKEVQIREVKDMKTTQTDRDET